MGTGFQWGCDDTAWSGDSASSLFKERIFKEILRKEGPHITPQIYDYSSIHAARNIIKSALILCERKTSHTIVCKQKTVSDRILIQANDSSNMNSPSHSRIAPVVSNSQCRAHAWVIWDLAKDSLAFAMESACPSPPSCDTANST